MFPASASTTPLSTILQSNKNFSTLCSMIFDSQKFNDRVSKTNGMFWFVDVITVAIPKRVKITKSKCNSYHINWGRPSCGLPTCCLCTYLVNRFCSGDTDVRVVINFDRFIHLSSKFECRSTWSKLSHQSSHPLSLANSLDKSDSSQIWEGLKC